MVQKIQFDNNFFAMLQMVSLEGKRYAYASTEDFSTWAEDNAAIYEAFLSAADPDGSYINLDEVVTINNDPKEGLRFYGPAIWRDPEDETKLVMTVGSALVPVTYDASKFYVGSLKGEPSGISAKRTIDGKEQNIDLPYVDFYLGRDFVFPVRLSPDASVPNLTKLDIKLAMEDGEPIAPLLAKVPSGGSGVGDACKLISIVYQEGKKERHLPKPAIIPIVGLVRVETKEETLKQYPNMDPVSYIVGLDPNYVPTRMVDPKGNDQSGKTAFYVSGLAQESLKQGFDILTKRLENGQPLYLEIQGYRPAGQGYSVVASIKAPKQPIVPAPAPVLVEAQAEEVSEPELATVG